MCALSAFCFLAEDTVAEIYQVWMFFLLFFFKRDSHISHIKRPSFSSSLCLMLLSAINLPFYDPQVINNPGSLIAGAVDQVS